MYITGQFNNRDTEYKIIIEGGKKSSHDILLEAKKTYP